MHLDPPTFADIERLADSRDALSVSVFLPTSHVPAHDAENRGRARALFERALETARPGADGKDVSAVEEHLFDLLDDDDFWSSLGRSLAVFATPDGIVEFRLANELTEYVGVADRFAITPLLRAHTFPQAAFVLALSQNDARLVEVTADGPAEEVRVPGIPGDAASAVGLRSIGGRSPYGRLQGDEGRKVRLTQYARAVDHALRPLVNGESLPLILAASEPLASIYRGVNGYSGLAAEGIDGNPDEITDAALADAARGILDAVYAEELARLADLFAQRGNSGRAATDLSDLARAAAAGAIDTLLIDMDAVVPGSVAADGTLVDEEAAPGHDVLEELARLALATRARVLAVRAGDLPSASPAAGILRYAI